MISKQATKGDKGQVGVGTLIVFIAIVLVAAVVASVLISVVEIISDRGTETATEGVEEVGDKLIVTGIFGEVNDTTSDNPAVENVTINVRRSAGAEIINLNNTLIDYSDDDAQYFLTSDGNDQVSSGQGQPNANTDDFIVNGLVDDSGGLNDGPFVLQTLQDRAEILVELEQLGGGTVAGGNDQPDALFRGENLDITLTTGSGAVTIESAQVPRLLNEETVRLDR